MGDAYSLLRLGFALAFIVTTVKNDYLCMKGMYVLFR